MHPKQYIAVVLLRFTAQHIWASCLINLWAFATPLEYCKTLFCCILISWFSYVENSLHFNLADFTVNFVKQFVSYSFYYRNSQEWYVYMTYFTKNTAYHIRKCWYSMQINLWWWATQKIHVYLICDSTQIAKIWCSRNIHVLQCAIPLIRWSHLFTGSDLSDNDKIAPFENTTPINLINLLWILSFWPFNFD